MLGKSKKGGICGREEWREIKREGGLMSGRKKDRDRE